MCLGPDRSVPEAFHQRTSDRRERCYVKRLQTKTPNILIRRLESRGRIFRKRWKIWKTGNFELKTKIETKSATPKALFVWRWDCVCWIRKNSHFLRVAGSQPPVVCFSSPPFVVLRLRINGRKESWAVTTTKKKESKEKQLQCVPSARSCNL